MVTKNSIELIELDSTEIKGIRGLISDIQDEHPSGVEEFTFLSQSTILSHELPRRVRRIFHNFKLNEPYLGILVRNGSELFDKIPPTPVDYFEKKDSPLFLTEQDIAHGLFASLLGEPFGFETQRWGHVYNSIMAKKELEDIANNSSGSKHTFEFHSEDAFHPGAPDYLGLTCVRNQEKAITTISSLQGIKLPENIQEALLRPGFHITSNDIHKDVVNPINERMKSVLFGDTNDPYLRLNENTLSLDEYDEEKRKALAYLLTQLHANKIEVILESGNFLYIDNFKTVHRRDAYTPNYGPELRLLKRVVVTNDLRKTRSMRINPGSRVINNKAAD